MEWNDDLLFKSNTSRLQSPEESSTAMGDSIESEDLLPPVRVRKTGKWADESKPSRKSSTNLIEQERFQDSRHADSDSDDIPVIPDMDDLQDDLLTKDEIKRATASVNKATYKELDLQLNSLQSGHKIRNLGNINLGFLTSRLYTEKDVKEVDEEWTMEELFDTVINLKQAK